MEIKTIGLASDHAGFALKQFVKKYLDEKGWAYKDYGTYTEDSCDYSDFGHALAQGIEQGEVFPGIAICGSGEGINMTLNKHQSIRAGLCWIPEIAHLIRQHNNANVLVMQVASSTRTWRARLWTNISRRNLKAVAIRSVSTRFLFRRNSTRVIEPYEREPPQHCGGSLSLIPHSIRLILPSCENSPASLHT